MKVIFLHRCRMELQMLTKQQLLLRERLNATATLRSGGIFSTHLIRITEIKYTQKALNEALNPAWRKTAVACRFSLFHI